MFKFFIMSLVFCLIFPCIVAAQTPTGKVKTIVIHNVNLVPMTSEIIMPNQTVIIKNNRIVQIGANSEIKIPKGATVIEGNSHYLMPGLADMHTHYVSSYERDTFFNLFLKNGVTTLRIFQSLPNDIILKWREDIKNQKIFGPTVFACGLFFNYPALPADTILTTKRNYDFIKLYSGLSQPEFQSIMRIAKKEHVYTIGHVPFLVGLDNVIAEGMNEIAHMTELDFDLVNYPKSEALRHQLFAIIYNNWVQDFYANPDKEAYLAKIEKNLDLIVTKVKNAGLFVDTTLVVTQIICEQLFEQEKFLKRPELAYQLKSFFPEYLAGLNSYQIMIKQLMNANKELVKGDNGSKFFDMYLELNRRLTKKMFAAGVPLVLGTDAPEFVVAVVPGYSIHEELRILTQCGLTPYQAIQTGTVNAGIVAKAMTGTNNIGTIELDKQANFILTAKNPFLDVANIQEITGLMVQGKWLSRAELDALKVEVKEELADLLKEIIMNKGDATAIESKYKQIKTSGKNEYPIHAETLNILAENCLERGKIAEAIAIFTIIVQEFPTSWEGYEHLAGAYLKAKNTELAIQYYQKALQLNPTNANLKKTVEELKKTGNE